MLALPRNIADWPEDWRFRFNERAAILEYLANFPRPIAESRAEEIIRREFVQELSEWGNA